MLNQNLDPASGHYFCNGNSQNTRKFNKKLEYFAGLVKKRRFRKAREIADLLLKEGCSRPLVCSAAYPVMTMYLRENLSSAIELASHFCSFPYHFECWLPDNEKERVRENRQNQEVRKYLNKENIVS